MNGAEKVAQTHINKTIIDFDFTTQNFLLYEYWPKLAELIQQANYVTVVTLCASPSELHSRTSLRIKKVVREFLLKPRIKKIMRFFRQLRKFRMYKDNSELIKAYEHWSKFIEEHAPTEHLLIDSTKTISTIAVTYKEAKVKEILKDGQANHPRNNPAYS